MFSTTCKRPLAAVAVAAGLLVGAAPASATLQAAPASVLQSSSLATTVANIASDGQGASHVPYGPRPADSYSWGVSNPG